jgi:hypothetical protein
LKKFLSSPMWAGVAVFTAFLIAGLTLYFSRPIKSLRVQILSNSPLVSISGDVGNDIKILYKDKPAQDVSLLLLRIENTGNQSIVESDYSEPVSFTLGTTAKISDAVVQETSPAKIPIAITVNNNQITLSKTLLNPGDQAVIKVLAIDNDYTLDLNGRIVGIKDLEKVNSLEPNLFSNLPPLIYFMLGVLFAEIVWAALSIYSTYRSLNEQLRESEQRRRELAEQRERQQREMDEFYKKLRSSTKDDNN